MDISKGIFKTLGDLNILLYAMRSGSIAVTGDRMAGMMYMFFYALYDNKRIHSTREAPTTTTVGSKRGINNIRRYYYLPRFIFESDTDTIIIPSKIQQKNGSHVSTIKGKNGMNIQNLKHISDDCKKVEITLKTIGNTLSNKIKFKKGWNNPTAMKYLPLTTERDWFPNNSNKNGEKITGKTPIITSTQKTPFSDAFKQPITPNTATTYKNIPKPNNIRTQTHQTNIRTQQPNKGEQQAIERANRYAKRQTKQKLTPLLRHNGLQSMQRLRNPSTRTT